MISIPRGYGFRSGIGATCEDGTQEDWTNISPNGRQYRSPITGQINDLQGSDYWWMRKQLPNKLSCASIISPDDYSTPSYYYKPKYNPKAKHSVGDGEGANVDSYSLEHKYRADSDEVYTPTTTDNNKEQESVFMSLTEDNVFRKLYMKLTRKEKQK